MVEPTSTVTTLTRVPNPMNKECRSRQVLEPDLTARSHTVVGVAALDQPDLLGAPAVQGSGGRGDRAAGHRLVEVRGVADADHLAPLAHPHGGTDAGEGLHDGGVHAPVHDPVGLE